MPQGNHVMAKDTTGRLHVTVKSAGRLKLSSKLWLERQLNDPYVQQAKRDGLRSRAAYKLIEIDDKYHILKMGASVVDLGAAPGGWSQIAAKRVGVENGKGRVIAIDLLEMPDISGVTFAQMDFLADDAPGQTARADGRQCRRGALRHGGQYDRPSQDRSVADSQSGRGRRVVRKRSAEAGRVRSSPRYSRVARTPTCWPNSNATSRP